MEVSQQENPTAYLLDRWYVPLQINGNKRTVMDTRTVFKKMFLCKADQDEDPVFAVSIMC